MGERWEAFKLLAVAANGDGREGPAAQGDRIVTAPKTAKDERR